MVAAYAFLRGSRVSEYALCTGLSEKVEERWRLLNEERDDEAYKAKLIDILNHYERCCSLLNDIRFFRGRAYKGLEQQIGEALDRNLKHEYVRDVFRTSCSSADTYCEIKSFLRRSKRRSLYVLAMTPDRQVPKS